MFTFLGSFKVYPMKWDCRVIKFSFTWRKYTMSIKFHCVFPWLTRNNWSEMISFKRWLWVSLVIANSEERGKWKSSFPPREQRWLEVGGWFLRGLISGTTTGLSWFITIGIWHAVPCLKVELSWGKLETGISFPFWIEVLIYFILTGDRV